jgi:DNA excision repair protein ERCC-5
MPKSFPSAAVAEAYAKPRVDLSRAKITHGRPDLELLRKFCFSKFGWSKVRMQLEG